MLFPFVATASFALIGMMFDSSRRVTFSPSAVDLAFASFPGVLLLALGCLLIAQPRSYLRFIVFVIVTAMICGVSAFLAFDSPVFLYRLPRYLLVMLLAQAAMFGMIGWIFGDTILVSGNQKHVHEQNIRARDE